MARRRLTARQRAVQGWGNFNGNQFNYPLRNREYTSGRQMVSRNGRISYSGS